MAFAELLYNQYKIENNRIRNLIRVLINKMEGGEFYSTTLRKIFKQYHGVEIGMYTHGGCFKPFAFDRYTVVGRYCSIARTARVLNRNHPMEFKSTHAFFFRPMFNLVKEDNIPFVPLEIGNDVWMGHNSIVMPNVETIGDGVVIGAGAVLNKNIPPYAVVVGNPARVVRYRFPEEIIKYLLEVKWWEKNPDELRDNIDEFIKPYEDVFKLLSEKKEKNS